MSPHHKLLRRKLIQGPVSLLIIRHQPILHHLALLKIFEVMRLLRKAQLNRKLQLLRQIFKIRRRVRKVHSCCRMHRRLLFFYIGPLISRQILRNCCRVTSSESHLLLIRRHLAHYEQTRMHLLALLLQRQTSSALFLLLPLSLY